MGSVASGIGNIVGSVAGGLTGSFMGSAGLGNQYQPAAPDITRQELLPQLTQAQADYTRNRGQQDALAQALLAQSQGQGPNPAAAMMKQAQDRANMQNAGMLASAKGVSPALAARMTAQNAAMGNQQVAQQTGILGAQQQLAAQQQLGGLYGQMGNQSLNQQQMLQSALLGQNNLNANMAQNQNQLGAQIAGQNAATRGQLISGLFQAGGSLMGLGMGAGGGKGAVPSGGTDSSLSTGARMEREDARGFSTGGSVPGQASMPGDSKSNDTVPAMLSPGEIVVPRTAAKDAKSAKAFIDHLMKSKGKRKKAS